MKIENGKLKIVVLVIAAVLLGGCISARMEYPDGRVFKYDRFMADQSVEAVIIETDGSILIEKQKSTMQGMTDALNKAIDKIPL